MSLTEFMTNHPDYAHVRQLAAQDRYDEAQAIENRLIAEYQETQP